MLTDEQVDMNRKIEAAIKESLPQQVGEQLKKELKELDRLRANTTTDEQTINRLERENADLTKERDEACRIASQHLDMNARELDLEKRERNLEMEKLKIKLSCTNQSREIMETFMVNMSKNTTYKRSFQGDLPGGIPVTRRDEYGSNVTDYPTTVSVNQETKIEEE